MEKRIVRRFTTDELNIIQHVVVHSHKGQKQLMFIMKEESIVSPDGITINVTPRYFMKLKSKLCVGTIVDPKDILLSIGSGKPTCYITI